MSEKHAYVNLVDTMGGDLAVVNSARVSYGKSSVELNDRDRRLIHRLLRDRHGTPFEQSVMTFYVRCPIVVAREWFRHRMGSFNEISGRYTKLETDFYVPRQFRVPAPDTAQMDYQYASASDEQNARATEALENLYDFAERTYEYLLELGIAKEHARLALPVGVYTEFRWTVNARALMNFLALRNHASAMREIRGYAQVVERFFADFMPVTHEAFVEYGRVAP